MIIKNKRGLSDVIATVLIILLAIAAIVIVWGFVSNYLGKAGEGIESQSACISVNAKPLNCVIDTSDNNATVNIQLVSGTIVNVISIAEKDDGSKKQVLLNL